MPNMDAATQVATILLNGNTTSIPGTPGVPTPDKNEMPVLDLDHSDSHEMDQSAKFFDPTNQEASQIREKVAQETLDELLDYLLNGGGAVGILDATNSTIERRRMLFGRIKAREPKLGILFIESVCQNPDVSDPTRDNARLLCTC